MTMHEFGQLRLVVNRDALDREGRAAYAALRAAMDAKGVVADAVETRGRKAAGEAARAAYDDGVRYIVVIGGDGTFHEVVNRLGDTETGLPEDLVLGVWNAGPGGDFARTVGLRLAPAAMATRLATTNTMDIDVGVVSYTTEAGLGESRLFVNVARVGYGAEVARIADRLPAALGRFRYLLAAWGGIRRTVRRPVRVELAHAGRKAEIVELVVANAQFTGGGMRIAPRAMPDDGRLSVLAFSGDRKQVFVATIDMFQGRHVPNPQISEWQSPFAGVESDEPLRIAADGRPLGVTPARFTLIERGLRLKI